jgi:(E)-4-hydroxy-3-methylbut-2-enyl-diphosphate synthase
MSSNEKLARENTRQIKLGGVLIGGGAPISVQTMANTDTRDVKASVESVKAFERAGCDIVRFAVPDMAAAEALADIKKACPDMPLVADIHFDWRLAIKSIEAGVDGLRINPGNIGGKDKVFAVANAAKARGIPIRIGVNAGSLSPELRERFGGATPEALVESAMEHVRLLEEVDFYDMKISVKASDIERTLAAYRLLSQTTNYPLHLGLTEAGTFLAGTVRSSVALGILLSEGIGDTIRISLTDEPIKEVKAGLELLRCLKLRAPGPNVTSCPTCGRTKADVFTTANKVEELLEEFYHANPNAARPHVAVMGCVVNGPGEAKDAEVALVGGDNCFFLYVKGERVSKHTVEEAPGVILDYVKRIS